VNSKWDVKQLLTRFQEFNSLETFFKFVKKIQDKSQFELRLTEFKGPRNNNNLFEVFCPHRPNCKFQVLYRYYTKFGDDYKMKE
jgi:hypothetical protein